MDRELYALLTAYRADQADDTRQAVADRLNELGIEVQATLLRHWGTPQSVGRFGFFSRGKPAWGAAYFLGRGDRIVIPFIDEVVSVEIIQAPPRDCVISMLRGADAVLSVEFRGPLVTRRAAPAGNRPTSASGPESFALCSDIGAGQGGVRVVVRAGMAGKVVLALVNLLDPAAAVEAWTDDLFPELEQGRKTDGREGMAEE